MHPINLYAPLFWIRPQQRNILFLIYCPPCRFPDSSASQNNTNYMHYFHTEFCYEAFEKQCRNYMQAQPHKTKVAQTDSQHTTTKKKHILAIKTKILTIKPTVIKVTLEKKKQILAIQNQKLQTVYKTSKTDPNIKKGLLVKHLCWLFWYVRVCICVLKDILPAKKHGPLVCSFFPQS